MYDVIVIGAGPAGLTASFFVGEENLKVALIGQANKSEVWKTPIIKNYPGFPDGITGEEFFKLISAQAHHVVSNIFDEDVTKIEISDGLHITTHSGKKLSAKALIIATGLESTLELPNFNTPGIFLCGAKAGANTISQAIGSAAIVSGQVVKYVKTIPSLKLL